jgi:hypothetical protein
VSDRPFARHAAYEVVLLRCSLTFTESRGSGHKTHLPSGLFIGTGTLRTVSSAYDVSGMKRQTCLAGRELCSAAK